MPEVLEPNTIYYHWELRNVGDTFIVPGSNPVVLHNRVWASFCGWKKRKPGRETYKIRTAYLQPAGLQVWRIA
jgi:hypothetical protein